MSGALIYIPVSLLFLFIGTALFSYYTARPELLQEGVTGDKVFPYFIFHQLPPGITGILVSSIFAAGMSTVSTSINSSATVIMNDYFGSGTLTEKGEKRSMKILYTSSAIFSLAGILIGVAMINVQSALDAWWKLASVFSGGMLGLFLLGLFSRNANRRTAIAGVITGLIVIGWISLPQVIFTGPLQKLSSPFHGYMAIVLGTTAIFVTGFLAGMIVKGRR